MFFIGKLDNSCRLFRCLRQNKRVRQAVYDYLAHVGTNVGRGAYQDAYGTEQVVFETRERLCRLAV